MVHVVSGTTRGVSRIRSRMTHSFVYDQVWLRSLMRERGVCLYFLRERRRRRPRRSARGGRASRRHVRCMLHSILGSTCREPGGLSPGAYSIYRVSRVPLCHWTLPVEWERHAYVWWPMWWLYIAWMSVVECPAELLPARGFARGLRGARTDGRGPLGCAADDVPGQLAPRVRGAHLCRARHWHVAVWV